MSEEKFSKCEEGGKGVSVEFRVFGKKIKKSSVKKNGKNFAKFVFTGLFKFKPMGDKGLKF